MTTQEEYDTRQERRRARIQNAAERARAAADATFARAQDMASIIPFGQPILVGHYSERGDRNYRARIDRTYRKSFELNDRAARLEAKLISAARPAISADDPSAVAQLQAKLARLERKQADMRTCNTLIRKHAKAGLDAQVAALLADGPAGMTQELAVTILTPDCFGGIGFASYQLSNNNAEIRRCRARIAELEAAAARPAAAGGENADGVSWGEDTDLNRVWIAFPGKPDPDVRTRLKRSGFRWAPSLNRWQRQTSPAALRLAEGFVTS